MRLQYRKFDDQNGVFCREAEERDQANLEMYVIGERCAARERLDVAANPHGRQRTKVTTCDR